MSDLELRIRQRRRFAGDLGDRAAHLRGRLRRAELSRERLRVAALLGDPLAGVVVDIRERLPEPSRLRHGFRRRLHSAFARFEAWLEDDDGPIHPYAGDLLERVGNLAPLGLEAAAELARIVIRLVSHDWTTLGDCLPAAQRVLAEDDPAEAFCAAECLCLAACDLIPPDQLWDRIRADLIAWGLGEPRAAPPQRPSTLADAQDDDPISRMTALIVEDAYVRGVRRILLRLVEDGVFVRYLGGRDDPDEERMRLPGWAWQQVLLRCRYMADLDVLAVDTAQQGVIDFLPWSRTGAGLDVRLELSVPPSGDRCSLTLLPSA